jgi:nucleoside-diphosphate-sugar epimerase
MERIAILGASSLIAQDLILSFARAGHPGLLLYGRNPSALRTWLDAHGLAYPVADYGAYGREPHDAVLNFVGVGDPRRAAQMGGSILGVTQEFDDLALRDLRDHPQRRYIFLSSGAAYASGFEEPAGPDTRTAFAPNALGPQDWYALAKLHAECKHRALPDLAITDLRVFNYVSRRQDLEARFFITDILRSIRAGDVLKTSPGTMVRDYLHPDDFYQLVTRVLAAPPSNQALDCYSAAPVDKAALLDAMARNYGLRYEVTQAPAGVNATGAKPHYYSLDRRAGGLGYVPAHTSLEGICIEADAILGRPGHDTP